MDKPVVKILTGMRRVGKSTLLSIIQNEILKGIPRKNKIYINFESLEFFHIKEAASLIQYLSPLLEKLQGKIYFFFDEVQLVEGWEKVINGLRVDRECDIYLTDSNYYVEDVQHVFHEAYRVLKKSGIFLSGSNNEIKNTIRQFT